MRHEPILMEVALAAETSKLMHVDRNTYRYRSWKDNNIVTLLEHATNIGLTTG